MTSSPRPGQETGIELVVNGAAVEVPPESSLMEVLRNNLGLTSVKDGCSPQGQCGCCTVLVDGQPRVSCVTPVRRVRGRAVTTLEGLDDAEDWAAALCATGGSQCGFCTPGIVVRLAGTTAKTGALSEANVRDALRAHLCRCTGWQTIAEAAVQVGRAAEGRDLARASMRAELEGGGPQAVAPRIAQGDAGFADDTAPGGALIAVRSASGDWVVGETLAEARARAGKVQGRRTTAGADAPVPVPDGQWALTLQTSWVEPAYLETDASWCVPGGEPASPLANGGAFGSKETSQVGAVARRLADRHDRPVRVLYSREDCVRLGPKRPPLAAGVREDGSGTIVVARTPGIADAIAAVAPRLEVHEVDVGGPPTSAAIRGAGWAEAAILVNAVSGGSIVSPPGAVASADYDGTSLAVTVECGDILDAVTLRSYCIGAAHMAYSWVTSESLVVDDDGAVQDLTIRSFGVVRAVDTPHIDVTLIPSAAAPINGSDAVFAAAAGAVWQWLGHPPRWPAGVVGTGADGIPLSFDP